MRFRSKGSARHIGLSIALGLSVATFAPELPAAPKRKAVPAVRKNAPKQKAPPPARLPQKPPADDTHGSSDRPRLDPASEAPTEFRGPTRIDFDDRLIQGQTTKSGAVYLFDRKETGISSMVRRRKSFKDLTLATIYDER